MLFCFLYESLSFLWELDNFKKSAIEESIRRTREQQERRDEEYARQVHQELQTQEEEEERMQQQQQQEQQQQNQDSNSETIVDLNDSLFSSSSILHSDNTSIANHSNQRFDNIITNSSSSSSASASGSSSSSSSSSSSNIGRGVNGTREIIEQQNRAFEEATRMDEQRERELEIKNRKLIEEQRKILLRKELRAQKGQDLPSEPSDSDSDIVRILFKFSSGKNVTRRFKHSNTIGTVFDFLDVHEELDVENYCLVLNYPTRKYNLQDHCHLTLKDVGFDKEEQIVMFVTQL